MKMQERCLRISSATKAPFPVHRGGCWCFELHASRPGQECRSDWPGASELARWNNSPARAKHICPYSPGMKRIGKCLPCSAELTTPSFQSIGGWNPVPPVARYFAHNSMTDDHKVESTTDFQILSWEEIFRLYAELDHRRTGFGPEEILRWCIRRWYRHLAPPAYRRKLVYHRLSV